MYIYFLGFIDGPSVIKANDRFEAELSLAEAEPLLCGRRNIDNHCTTQDLQVFF